MRRLLLGSATRFSIPKQRFASLAAGSTKHLDLATATQLPLAATGYLTGSSSRRSSSTSNQPSHVPSDNESKLASSRTAGGARRHPVTPYPQSPTRTVPPHIVKPPYADTGIVPYSSWTTEQIIWHDDASVDRMRMAARLARQALDVACAMVRPGLTTDDLDKAVHDYIIERGAYPSPLNYAGFPKSLCTSINEIICHGIPDLRRLQLGDVISLDVSCYVTTQDSTTGQWIGVHGDNCATVIVGDEQPNNEIGVDWRGTPYRTNFDHSHDEAHVAEARRLVSTTHEALYAGIEACRPGACLSDIGAAIEAVSDREGYSSVRKYRGHGISTEFHCAPFVRHYRNNDKLELQPGMIFTIEPMITQGSGDCFEWDDDWTVSTVDGGLSAQFEHTVLITDDGVEILTLPE